MKNIIFIFGHFDPPTSAHVELINEAKKMARLENSDYLVVGNPKENILPTSLKEIHMKRILNENNVIIHPNIKTPFDVISSLENKGYDDITMMVTNDQLDEIKRILPKNIGIVSGGVTNPDEDKRILECVISGDVERMKIYLPENTSSLRAEKLMKDIQTGIKMELVVENTWFDYNEYINFVNKNDIEKSIETAINEITNKTISGFNSFLLEVSPIINTMRKDKEETRGTGIHDKRSKDAARKRAERAESNSKKGSIKDYYIVQNNESGIYELVNRTEKHMEALTGPDDSLRPTTLSELIRIFKDTDKTFRITPTSRKFLPKSLTDKTNVDKYKAQPEGKGKKAAGAASSGQRIKDVEDGEPEIEEPTTRSFEFLELDSVSRTEFVKTIISGMNQLEDLASNTGDKIISSSPEVKQWFNTAKSLYDAYKEDPDKVEMYTTNSEIKDFINKFENLQSTYDKESELIDTLKVVNSIQGLENTEDFKSFTDRLQKSTTKKIDNSRKDSSKRHKVLENNHKALWNNADLAKEISGINSILHEITDLTTSTSQYKSPERGNLIQRFTSINYENDGWQLSKLSQQLFGLNESDFRLKKKINDCTNGTNAQVDCDFINDSYSANDIKMFSKYQKMQKNLMHMSGLVNSDNTFDAFRLYYDKEGRYSEGNGFFSGSYADSWSLSTKALGEEWGGDITERLKGFSLDKSKLFILKSRIPLNRLISSYFSDLPEGVEYSDKELESIKMYDGNASYIDHNQNEVIVNSSDSVSVEIVPYGEKVMNKLTEEKKNQTLNIRDKYNLNWMRAFKENSFIDFALEPEDPNAKPYTIINIDGKETKIDIERDIIESFNENTTNYKLKESQIEGIGTYSTKNIIPNEIIGKYMSSYLSEDGNEYQQRTELCRFTNHAKLSNTYITVLEDGNFYSVAERYIPEDEELTVYYPDVYNQIMKRIENGSIGSIPEVEIIADEYKNMKIPLDKFSDIFGEYDFLKNSGQLNENKRNYKKEYREYHGKPDQIKRRANRVQARRDMEATGRVHKGDGKDIDHKDGNPMNNKKSNLRVTSRHYNRSRNNNKNISEEHGAGEWGTFELLRKYLRDTPHMKIQSKKEKLNR